MQEVKKTALVSHPCADMYALVTDIEAYPQFIQWCDSAVVLSTDSLSVDSLSVDSLTLEEKVKTHVSQVCARVGINYRGVKQSFTTKNTNIPNQSVEMHLHESSDHWLRHLKGHWLFTDLGTGTKIELQMQFDISNGMLRRIISPVFNHVVNSQLDAFVARANVLASS